MKPPQRCSDTILLVAFLLFLLSASSAFGGEDVRGKLARAGAEFETDSAGNIVEVYFSGGLAVGEDLLLLAGLDHVTDIGISGVKLGDDGLRHLKTLSNLKQLDASDTKCTDKDLQHLIGITAIERINLSDTSITDASVATLLAMPNLKWVDLSATRMTVEGILHLRQQKPGLHIRERWNYSVGTIAGVGGFLDLERVTIIFDYVRVPESGGAWGGGSIEVSKPLAEENGFVTTSGGGGGIGPDSVSATLDYVNGVPTLRVGKHTVEIKNEGRDVVVDGQQFSISKKKIRIKLTAEGVATLLD